jgi:hypothetical protein
MFQRIKNLLKPEKPALLVVTFDEIPCWLDARQGALSTSLADRTAAPMHAIRDSVTSLQHIIQLLRAAEYNDEIHPKLKSIAKNTLPQYTKAMDTLLSKPLEGDIEEFYGTATDILKGCINSTQGQGKYLRTVFPEEMKTVWGGIGAIGREINTMTEALGQFRKDTTRITEARTLHGALADIWTDIEQSYEKEQRIGQRIDETRNRIGACEQELAALEREESRAVLADQRHALETLKEERDRTARRYASLSMTAAHVLGKSEKLAHKQRSSADEAVLKRAMALLSSHEVPQRSDLVQVLGAACPVAAEMIGRGEISLKNREERELFSDPAGFIAEMGTLSEKYSAQTSEYEAAEQALRSHPVLARSGNLTREKTQLTAMLDKEVQSRSELVGWRSDLRKNIPGLQQKLEKEMGEISGGDVQVQYPQILATSL